MPQIGYKGIVTASLRDRQYRSRNEGKLQLFTLLTSFLCSSPDSLSEKYPMLPGFLGIQKITEDGLRINLLHKYIILSGAHAATNNVAISSSAKFSALIACENIQSEEVTQFKETDRVEYVLYTKAIKNVNSASDEYVLATAPIDNPDELLTVAVASNQNILVEWEMIFSNLKTNAEEGDN